MVTSLSSTDVVGNFDDIREYIKSSCPVSLMDFFINGKHMKKTDLKLLPGIRKRTLYLDEIKLTEEKFGSLIIKKGKYCLGINSSSSKFCDIERCHYYLGNEGMISQTEKGTRLLFPVYILQLMVYYY